MEALLRRYLYPQSRTARINGFDTSSCFPLLYRFLQSRLLQYRLLQYRLLQYRLLQYRDAEVYSAFQRGSRPGVQGAPTSSSRFSSLVRSCSIKVRRSSNQGPKASAAMR